MRETLTRSVSMTSSACDLPQTLLPLSLLRPPLVVVEASVTVVVRSQVESLTRKVLTDATFVQIRGHALPFEKMKQ